MQNLSSFQIKVPAGFSLCGVLGLHLRGDCVIQPQNSDHRWQIVKAKRPERHSTPRALEL